MKISILGCGLFGSAIKDYLIKKGHIVYEEEIKDAETIFVTVPSYAVLDVLEKKKAEITNQNIIICSKGFHSDGELLSLSLEEIFSFNEIFFMYGPSLAEEIEKGLFTSFVLAGKTDKKEEIKKELESENFYIELSDDVVGVEVSAALKNVVTIFVGFIEGSELGQNLKAFVFTKGVEAIMQVGLKKGAQRETFLGLACLGDLTLDSRNRNLGIMLGKGSKVSDFKQENGYPREGLATLKIIKDITDDIYFEVIYDIIFEGLSAEDGIKRLLVN